MLHFRLLAAIALLSQTLATPAATCNNIQIFIAVGHGETYPGTQKSITNLVCSGRASCGTSNIDYPSTSTNSYCSAVATGIKNGIASITAYVTSCPNATIVLTGWSQGAQVVTDIISGGGGTGLGNVAKGCKQDTSDALDPTSGPGKNVVAVAVYGDPRHTASQTFNAGTAASKNGVWPRTGTQLAAENLWAAKLRSYCTGEDIACANGSSSADHGSYFGSYASTPAKWIISMLK